MYIVRGNNSEVYFCNKVREGFPEVKHFEDKDFSYATVKEEYYEGFKKLRINKWYEIELDINTHTAHVKGLGDIKPSPSIF